MRQTIGKAIEVLRKIHDEADHALGTEGDVHGEVLEENMRAIKHLAREFLG